MVRENKESVCVGRATRRGQKIDFLGYQFTNELTLLRKSIKQHFARKVKRIKNKERRQKVLASYWGWCKWGDCRNLWNKITDNDMSFADRGIMVQKKTKDGKRFFDEPTKNMMEILNTPILLTDFETGVKTRNGNDRYAVLFKIQEQGEWKSYKVITNSFTLKSVLDQVREYDNMLMELRERVQKAKEQFGENYDISRLGLSEDERKILETNTPMLPQKTVIHRRDLGGGKYDYYFE